MRQAARNSFRNALAASSIGLGLSASVAFAEAPTPDAAATPAVAAAAVFKNESEAGIIITSGNSSAQSFNFKQLNSFAWDKNLFAFSGKYLNSNTEGVDTALLWNLGLRYERELSAFLSAFAGQDVESDIFSGYAQRYNTDLGGKYFIDKEEAFYWDVEAGYRYTIENRLTGQVNQNYLRFYTEANRDWTQTFSTKVDIEYLPNLTVASDYQLNGEISASAAITAIFAIKSGYVVKYRHLPPPPALKSTDTQFVTALVAKF